MNTEHRCLFCDHVFVGRRRKFCYDCLPAHGSVHSKVYASRYNALYIACGLHPQISVLASTNPSLPISGPRKPKPRKAPIISPLQEWECAVCGARRVTPADRIRKYCSKTCAGRAGARAKRKRPRICDLPGAVRFAPAIGLDVDGVPLKRCIQCATVFRQNRTSNVCSDECRVRTRQDKRRRKESRRRANGGDPYSLTDVVRKSDGHCHLCSLPVNLTLPGSHPDGATVDHLIPVSLGGADDIANVALAHRRCNVLRGVKPLEAADVAR